MTNTCTTCGKWSVHHTHTPSPGGWIPIRYCDNRDCGKYAILTELAKNSLPTQEAFERCVYCEGMELNEVPSDSDLYRAFRCESCQVIWEINPEPWGVKIGAEPEDPTAWFQRVMGI